MATPQPASPFEVAHKPADDGPMDSTRRARKTVSTVRSFPPPTTTTLADLPPQNALGLPTPPSSISKAFSTQSARRPPKRASCDSMAHVHHRISVASLETTQTLPLYEPDLRVYDEAERGLQGKRTEAGALNLTRKRQSVLSTMTIADPPSYAMDSSVANGADDADTELDRLIALSSSLLDSSLACLSSTVSSRSAVSSLSSTVSASLDRTIRSAERELRRRLDGYEERRETVLGLERDLGVGWAASGRRASSEGVRTHSEEARQVKDAIVKAEKAAAGARSPVALAPSSLPAEGPMPRRRPGGLPHVRSASRTVPRYDTIYVTAESDAFAPSNFAAPGPSSVRESTPTVPEQPSAGSPSVPVAIDTGSPTLATLALGTSSLLGRFFRDQKSASPSPLRQADFDHRSGTPSPRATDLLHSVSISNTRRYSDDEPRGRTRSDETIVALPSTPFRSPPSPAGPPTSTATSLRFSASDWDSEASSSPSRKPGGAREDEEGARQGGSSGLHSPLSSYDRGSSSGLEDVYEADEDDEQVDTEGAMDPGRLRPSSVRPRHKKRISGSQVARPALIDENAPPARRSLEPLHAPTTGTARDLLKSLWAQSA